ncbi:amidohydrolase family protein [Roseomonas sp. BN140053]|uniref:amidohydrolase family protein n=1 Tax=Roseomonas sp. BN140053 TaxID=3391898 RepID=UPI0039EBC439
MLDIYTHILPADFARELDRTSPKLGNISKRLRGVQPLHDMEARFRAMDAVSDYRQVISLPNPPLEEIASAAEGQLLARVANDAMAELCARHPDRFPAFVAAVSMLDMGGAEREAERAIRELGARGVQIFTNVAGQPLDRPEYRPIFALAAAHDLPLWLHPARTADMPDYAAEAKSRYEMWWCFGWPYETSVAMSRLVFSGVFDRYPGLKIVTHHCGGMIPYFDGRVGPGLEVLGSRTSDEDYSGVLPALKRPHIEYFREFYADTAMFGSSTGLHSGLRFFGARKLVFSTDAPLGPLLDTIRALDALELSVDERRDVMSGNAERLLRLHEPTVPPG